MSQNSRGNHGNDVQIETFADYQIIRQPNPLKAALRPASPLDGDPVERAEKALAQLSVEFDGWMQAECDELTGVYAGILHSGVNEETTEELLRAALHIKGNATTFGYPLAAAAAESLCRIIEYAPDFTAVPVELIGHHVNAVQAIIREHKGLGVETVASELSRKLRSVGDEYLVMVNRDRPELLEIIGAPSIVPGG